MSAIPSTHVSLLCDLRDASRQGEAWVTFQTRYRGVLLRWCRRRGVPPSEAEDLTQDILLRLFQQLPRYHHDPARGQFRSWLQTVVHNILFDYWRRQRRQPERAGVGGTDFQERLVALASPEAAGDLSGEIEGRAQTVAADVLERVRNRLKETTWQAFYQSMVERRPAADVAIELNLSVATVYKANFRVKQMLLEEYRSAHDSGRGSVPASGDVEEVPA